MFATFDTQLTWHLARAGGMVAWAVATASILWGLTLSTRLIRKRGIAPWLLDLHRFLGTLTVVFVIVHLAALYADKYVHFGFRELFVPMASGWRSGAVAWGIVSFYFLIAIQVTSRFMRRLPRRLWHTVHLSSFLMFVGGTIHGFQAGADAGRLVVQWSCLVAATLVVFLTAFRLLAPRKEQRRAGALARTGRNGGPLSAAQPIAVNGR